MNLSPITLALIVLLYAVGALLIRLGCRWSAGFLPSWRSAFLALTKCAVPCFALSLPAYTQAGAINLSLQLFLSIICLCVCAWILGSSLQSPEKKPIGIKNGFFVSLVWSGGAVAVIVTFATLFATQAPKTTQDQAIPGPHAAGSKGVRGIDFDYDSEWRPQPVQPNQSASHQSQPSLPTASSPPLDPSIRAAFLEIAERFPYFNGPDGEKWDRAVVAWSNVYVERGELRPSAIRHGAEMVDRYRAAGSGTCYPIDLQANQIQCE